MDQTIPRSIKVLVWILVLSICTVLFFGLWRPEGQIMRGHGTIHLQPLVTRLIVLALGAAGFFLTWMLAKGRMWACYLFLILFGADLIRCIIGRLVELPQTLIDVYAVWALIAYINGRRTSAKAGHAAEAEPNSV